MNSSQNLVDGAFPVPPSNFPHVLMLLQIASCSNTHIPFSASKAVPGEHSRSIATPLTHCRYLAQWYGSAILMEGRNREKFLIKNCCKRTYGNNASGRAWLTIYVKRPITNRTEWTVFIEEKRQWTFNWECMEVDARKVGLTAWVVVSKSCKI